MKKLVLVLGLFGLGGCAPDQDAKVVASLQTPPGQLFCMLEKDGTQLIVTAVNAEASALNPALGPVAVVVTGLAASEVQKFCDEAAKSVGAATGIPISPPPPGTVTASVAVSVK